MNPLVCKEEDTRPIIRPVFWKEQAETAGGPSIILCGVALETSGPEMK